MLKREIINYNHVQFFFETFMRKRPSEITNKSAPFERGVNLKA